MLQAINRSGSDKSLYLVCFDIVSDRIRYRVVKCLKTYGQRVQKSGFECMLNDKQYLEMKSALDKLIKPDEDSIRYYLLCKNCARNIAISGLGTYTEDEEVIII